MPRFLISLMFCLCAGVAWGQPGQRTWPGDTPADAREQRRVELREVLKTSRKPGRDSGAAESPPTSTAPPSRHLTPQERFELREQLRREQIENRRNRP